jgi:BirA family transcriptional regulator, biotin operon repressor / biotin---[acetyl-CoA-carboxylase] ligase
MMMSFISARRLSRRPVQDMWWHGFSMDSSLAKIRSLSFVEQLIHLDSIDSTNTFAKELAALPACGLAVICADTQRAGRGRGDNSFYSEARGGLLTSLVSFVPDIGKHFSFNRAISLAICDAIQNRFEFSPLFIKWPNDIYWQDKKLCGTLLETIPGRQNHIIIGFGVNVNLQPGDFPPTLRHVATSVLIETGITVDIHELLHDILTLYWNYCAFPKAEVHALYSERLYRVGATVEINGQKGLFTGVLEDGSLCLKSGHDLVTVMSGSMRFLQNSL